MNNITDTKKMCPAPLGSGTTLAGGANWDRQAKLKKAMQMMCTYSLSRLCRLLNQPWLAATVFAIIPTRLPKGNAPESGMLFGDPVNPKKMRGMKSSVCMSQQRKAKDTAMSHVAGSLATHPNVAPSAFLPVPDSVFDVAI
mmetsp:Transcript_16939/g.33108  ORF Transcript_16939/g.33108 Transcript_16939/m.33108 type:complete len:141 (+) Transcript_16939:90-512(+)